jgi:hypothetical protein
MAAHPQVTEAAVAVVQVLQVEAEAEITEAMVGQVRLRV